MIQLALKTSLGKALIEDNGCSGEYAPAFSNKLRPCSVLPKSITQHKAFLTQPLGEG